MKNNFLASIVFILIVSANVFAKVDSSGRDSVTPFNSVTQGTPNLGCPQFQIFGYPTTSDTKILRRAFYTCRSGYAGLYDPATRTPLWIAEHLLKSDLIGSAEREFLDFIPDPDIPIGALPQPADYLKSGYDKGHLAPAADFKNSQTKMAETFQFANAVPQVPNSNRHTWKQLEDSTREVAYRRGEIYIISGPIFTANPRTKLRNSVSIPNAVFKILVDPKTRTMTGFVVPNVTTVSKEFRVYQIKVREIEKLTGLDFNPQLKRSDADKLEAVDGGDWLMPKSRSNRVVN
jgi:endonuclease G